MMKTSAELKLKFDFIPFNRPCFVGREMEYISRALSNGHISGGGPFTRLCQEFLERELGARKVLLTTSCTHALEMAALLLDIHEGDEVILPSFTFVSTVNAFALRGAKPVFVDIRPDTLNMNEELIEGHITSRTQAVVPVHYAGVGCDLDPIQAIARRHGIAVVEDNAHGLFGRYRGRYLGTFGCLATQSFHETKNFTCGEGGALVINDPALVERAEIIREKGTDRSRFFRGQVDKYTWVDLGSSYIPSDILAAFLYAQLEARGKVIANRRQIWNFYDRSLREWAQEEGVRLPIVPGDCEQSYHMFYMILPTAKDREDLIAHLEFHGILGVFHYVPLHLSKMGKMRGGKAGDCPVTEDLSDRLVRLPFYYGMSRRAQGRVIEAIKSFTHRHNRRVWV